MSHFQPIANVPSTNQKSANNSLKFMSVGKLNRLGDSPSHQLAGFNYTLLNIQKIVPYPYDQKICTGFEELLLVAILDQYGDTVNFFVK